MSGLAGLYNVPLTPESRAVWAFAHMAHHRDINRRILELTTINLPEFVLDPLDPSDTHVWEEQHQIMHINMDTILGIQGFDLSFVEFSNEEQLQGWILLNATEHYQAAAILELD